jgi:hypothetical protein
MNRQVLSETRWDEKINEYVGEDEEIRSGAEDMKLRRSLQWWDQT